MHVCLLVAHSLQIYLDSGMCICDTRELPKELNRVVVLAEKYDLEVQSLFSSEQLQMLMAIKP